MNVAAYIVYLFLTYLITVQVGLIFYRHGRIYLLRLLHGDDRLTNFINRALLTGYYLLNLGYAALQLKSWQQVDTLVRLLDSVLGMTGRIMLLLSVIHFMNMAVILLFSMRKELFHHPKK